MEDLIFFLNVDDVITWLGFILGLSLPIIFIKSVTFSKSPVSYDLSLGDKHKVNPSFIEVYPSIPQYFRIFRNRSSLDGESDILSLFFHPNKMM